MRSGRRRVSAALALVVFAGCSGSGDGDGESGGSTAPAEPATTATPTTTEDVTTTAAPTTIATTTTVAPVAVDTPCPNPISSRCGTVAVPLDRANPDAGTIDIYFEVVSHADTSQPTAGTLLALNGGPGPATLSSGPAGWSDLASDGYDLVLTDYRGTGRSAALHCATQDNGFPSEIQAARTTVQTCGEEIRDQAALYDTAATADDLEAVRTALGVGQLDVLGISYGTYVAQVFASRHPDAVRAVILDGAMPVGAPAPGDGAHYSVPNLRAALAALETMCARSNGACSPEQVTADLSAVVEQVRAAPSPGLPEAMVLARLLLDPSTLTQVPAALRAAAQGDRSRLEGLAAPFQIQPISGGPLGPVEEFSAALSSSIACNDFQGEFTSSERTAREEQVAAEIAALPPDALAPFTGQEWVTLVDVNAGYRSLCVGWPVSEAASGDEQGAALPDVPVLVMNGDFDVSTPMSGAEQAARDWPGAVLVRFPNVGHTPLLSTSCAATVMTEFVTTLAVADVDVCAAAVPPLVPAA